MVEILQIVFRDISVIPGFILRRPLQRSYVSWTVECFARALVTLWQSFITLDLSVLATETAT